MFGSMNVRTSFDVARPKHMAKIMQDHVEMVRIDVLFFFWKKRQNLRAGRNYTWVEFKASVANTFKS